MAGQRRLAPRPARGADHLARDPVPAATNGYDDLLRHAVDFDIEGVPVKVASLADIIRSKETANRPKDQRTLPILYALQDEIARTERRDG